MYDVIKMRSFKTKNEADCFIETLDPQVDVLVCPTKTKRAIFVPSQGNRRIDSNSPVWVVVVAD